MKAEDQPVAARSRRATCAKHCMRIQFPQRRQSLASMENVMLLNLGDPESIVAWWRVFPEQHDNYLSHKLKVSPEFASSILEARRRIEADPALCGLLRTIQRHGSEGQGREVVGRRHEDLLAA